MRVEGKRSAVLFAVGAVIAGALAAAPVSALAETIDHTAAGFYRNDAAHGGHTYNGDIYAGSGALPLSFRGYIVFTIPAGDPVTAATLRIGIQTVANGPNTFGVYEVTTPAATLLSGAGGVPAYDDLGDGAVYATVPNVVGGAQLDIPLPPAAVAAINAAQGGTFAVGFNNETVDTDYDYLVGGGASWPRELILTRGPAPVPTVGEWTLIGLAGAAGLGGAFVLFRRRRLAA